MTDAAATAPGPSAEASAFLETQEHRRFTEFCDAVRRHRYIGICYGPPGIGKTVSARHYAGWDIVGPFLSGRDQAMVPAPAAALTSRTIVYTPAVVNSPRRIEFELYELCKRLNWGIKLSWFDPVAPEHDRRRPARRYPNVDLILVDEADRLKNTGLEQLRDHHDRTGTGLVLIGMPGIERRLARYPQLYSRVGFAHQFRTLAEADLATVLDRHWEALGQPLQRDDPDTAEALSAIVRITQGNFRLVQRLFAQIQRVLELNELDAITREVVETAREALVIGAS